jgi:predicted DNA-binding WGR domain protein
MTKITQVPLLGWHLTMVNAATNTNKFYDVFLTEDGHVIIQWGRIGTQGQCKVEKMDYAGAKNIAMKQVYGKAAKGYKTIIDEFKFNVGADILKRALDMQSVGQVQQAFSAAQRDNRYGGERDSVYSHYDSFITQAQHLMDRAADLDIGQVMDEWAQIQGAFEEINVKHQTAATTIALTQQMVSQKLMGGS